MKAVQVLMQETREGFRLIISWVIGFLSFGFFSAVVRKLISHLEPWKALATVSSETEYILLVSLAGLVLFALAGDLVWTGFRRRRFSPPDAR